jgi:hypothetical protein
VVRVRAKQATTSPQLGPATTHDGEYDVREYTSHEYAGQEHDALRSDMEPLAVDAATQSAELSERDLQILEFERQWWKYAGAKEQAVRDLFGMSATRYYQVLNALIDTPAAMAADPMLVKRLRRMRASRQRARSARRLGMNP